MNQETQTKKSQSDLLSRRQVADLLSVNLSTLFNWNKSGILPSYRLGGRIYYKKTDIDDSLKRVVNLKDGRGE